MPPITSFSNKRDERCNLPHMISVTVGDTQSLDLFQFLEHIQHISSLALKSYYLRSLLGHVSSAQH